MILKYATGQQIAILLRSLQELVVRALVSPTELAAWNLITIIASTVMLFQANVVAASNRLLAQMHGSGADKSRIKSVRGNSIYLELFQQTLLSLGLLIVAPMVWDAPESLGSALYCCAVAVMVSNGLIGLLVGLHESSSHFPRLGFVLPLNAAVQVLFILLGIQFFGIQGLVGGAIIGLALNVVMLMTSLRISKAPWLTIPNLSVGKSLTGTAVSFRLADLPTSSLYLLDTILASIWLAPGHLALYVTARVLVNFSSQVVFVASRIGLIRLGNRIGAQSTKAEISRFMSLQFVLVFLVLLPLSVVVFEPAFRWFVPLFLKDYAASISILPFLLLSGLTSPRALFLRNYWIHKSEWKKIAYSGTGGLLGAVLVFWCGINYFGEVGMRELAILTLICQLPYALGLIVAVTTSEEARLHLVYRLGIFLFSFLSIGAALFLNGALSGESIDSIFICAIEVAVGILVVAPSILIGWWVFRHSTLLENRA